jgi:hypothetical protein
MASDDDFNELSGRLAATETVLIGLFQDFLRRSHDPRATANAMIAEWTTNISALAGKPVRFATAYENESI